jgi:S1-C subfamily serine protease
MYTMPYSQQMSGLGFTMPSWLTSIVGKVVKGTTVTIPTPAGNVVVDLNDPNSVAAAYKMLTGAKISTNLGPKPASPISQFNTAVESNVPGGWLTVAAVAGLAVFVLPKLLGRRGR